MLLADGLGAGAIAQKLYLSESTAKSHIARIYQKLGATNRAQALVTAMRIGLLSSLPSRDTQRLTPAWRLAGAHAGQTPISAFSCAPGRATQT